MTRPQIVLCIVLVASLGVNAYLWATTPGHHKPPSLAPRDVPIKPMPPGMPDLKLRPPTLSVPSTYAAEDRAELEQRLVEVEARIDELLRPPERYPLLARSPETEEKVRPYLDRVFSKFKEEKPPYSVECHGRVCKVSSSHPDGEWMEELQQTFPGREMFSSMAFGPDGTFVELRAHPDGRMFVKGILFGAITELEACGVTKATGTLSFSFALDPASHTIHVVVGGSAAHEPVGECVRKAVENVAASADVSPDLTSVPAESINWVLPLPPPPLQH